MAILPRLPFERILKKAGAKRVSEEALEELANIMEARLEDVASNAVMLAKHAGRKTMTADDVRMARRKMRWNSER